MEVILKQDVDNLGFKDEIVTVKDGYGRNYLIPRGMAVIASGSARKMMEETIRQRAHKEEKMIKDAEAMQEKLNSAKISVAAKAGEKGKIFGSVNNIQVANALKELGFELDRKNIELKDENIKELGTYQAKVRLYKHVESNISFDVIAETD